MFWVRIAHFIKNVCVFLLCIFMFWVPCCSFHTFFLCCPVMYLYVLISVLLISLVFSWCPVMYLYVLSSVLLISLFVFVLSCYVSVCSEFRVAHFFSFFCVVLLCIFIFWVPCCLFLNFLCCPVMYLYVLSSVLLISLVFLCCPVMCLYVLCSVLLIS